MDNGEVETTLKQLPEIKDVRNRFFKFWFGFVYFLKKKL